LVLLALLVVVVALSVVVKVTRKYQVTIPEEIRRLLDIKVGDRILTEFDPVEGVAKLHPLHRGKRSRMTLSHRLTLEEIEEAIVRGVRECTRSQP
jgi:AbrB family looped-hinge helix DNA binding protein